MIKGAYLRKLLAVTLTVLSASSSFAFETVSLSEQMEQMQLTATKAIVEGRLWAVASKVCLEKGKEFAVQADKGFTYEVLQIPKSTKLRLGGFARFECMDDSRP